MFKSSLCSFVTTLFKHHHFLNLPFKTDILWKTALRDFIAFHIVPKWGGYFQITSKSVGTLQKLKNPLLVRGIFLKLEERLGSLCKPNSRERNEVNIMSDEMSHFSSKNTKQMDILENKSRIKYCVNITLKF